MQNSLLSLNYRSEKESWGERKYRAEKEESWSSSKYRAERLFEHDIDYRDEEDWLRFRKEQGWLSL